MNIVTMGESLGTKGVESLLADEKNLKPTDNWVVATRRINDYGFVDINTGGGDKWNSQVAERLSKKAGKKVLFIGPTPDYNDDMTYRYAIEAKNNREAAVLLSPTDE